MPIRLVIAASRLICVTASMIRFPIVAGVYPSASRSLGTLIVSMTATCFSASFRTTPAPSMLAMMTSPLIANLRGPSSKSHSGRRRWSELIAPWACKFADADPFGVCAAGVVMRTVMTSSYRDRQMPAAPFMSMPKKDFGRCDGHHEMDDFHARKNAPLRAWTRLFLSKESPEHAGAFQEGTNKALIPLELKTMRASGYWERRDIQEMICRSPSPFCATICLWSECYLPGGL